jgi:beta-1,2-mannobiose phosphorylase / 1,2-beta-oligomannan phosphorylase
MSPDRELFTRSPANPILSAADWPYPANSVFNPGATFCNGETVLLCRVEDRRGISHLTVARSPDGIGDWRIEAQPLLAGDDRDPVTRWGVEDPRITFIDEVQSWYIAYTAYGPGGPAVALAATRDFKSVEKIGIVMSPEDKNASMLSRQVDGHFVMLHRPSSQQSHRADIWLSRSMDLRSWRAPEPVLAARQGAWWDSVRVGMGPPPLETEHGWLGIYHGVKATAGGGPTYRMGLVLLDPRDPARLLRRSPSWVFTPAANYERIGDLPNVVFPTGLVHDPATDELRLYYGAADSTIAVATARLADLLEYILRCPSDGADPYA